MKLRLDMLALVAAAALLLWAGRNPANQSAPQAAPTLQGHSTQHNACVPINLGDFIDSTGELAGGG
jgi:hypothetical protein